MSKRRTKVAAEPEELELVTDDPEIEIPENAEAAETEAAEKTPEPPPEPPKPKAQQVRLQVFLKLAGRWDQVAGFKRYAEACKLKPRSIPEWRIALDEYKNRPVK